jgi:hypothetical protein
MKELGETLAFVIVILLLIVCIYPNELAKHIHDFLLIVHSGKT